MINEIDWKTGIKDYSKKDLIKRRDDLVTLNLECQKHRLG
jgi:hypothetical protein